MTVRSRPPEPGAPPVPRQDVGDPSCRRRASYGEVVDARDAEDVPHPFGAECGQDPLRPRRRGPGHGRPAARPGRLVRSPGSAIGRSRPADSWCSQRSRGRLIVKARRPGRPAGVVRAGRRLQGHADGRSLPTVTRAAAVRFQRRRARLRGSRPARETTPPSPKIDTTPDRPEGPKARWRSGSQSSATATTIVPGGHASTNAVSRLEESNARSPRRSPSRGSSAPTQ
jgi:hypothetical protein